MNLVITTTCYSSVLSYPPRLTAHNHHFLGHWFCSRADRDAFRAPALAIKLVIKSPTQLSQSFTANSQRQRAATRQAYAPRYAAKNAAPRCIYFDAFIEPSLRCRKLWVASFGPQTRALGDFEGARGKYEIALDDRFHESCHKGGIHLCLEAAIYG